MIDDAFCRVGHAFKKAVVIGVPEVLHLPDAVDIFLAVARSKADGYILERTAEAAHRMALEVRQDEHGIVLRQSLADVVYVKMLSAGNGDGHLALGVHDIDVGDLDPAVQLHGLFVALGRIAAAVIGGVALHYGSADMLYGGLHEVRAQEVLVSRLAAVQLHGNVAL